jgi:hypothetical protein
MKTLPPDLEALMPEPDLVSFSYDSTMRKYEHHSFTADQVRAAILGATERAAKLAATLAYDAAIKYANGREVDFEKEVAAAIRGAAASTSQEKEGAKGS